MSVKKFRFVSPGIFINEIDNSQLPKTAEGIGPVVIGRAERGPGMRPVTVNSFSEFVEMFGNPIPGGEGGDIWRDGNRTAPTYAAYAAQAWLRNAGPLTFIRLLGHQHDDATAAGAAGWAIENGDGDGDAYGLFVGKVPADGATESMALAAVVYVRGTTACGLSGTTPAATTETQALRKFIKLQGSHNECKIKIGDVSYSVNFSSSSKKYIRKVLNTNPTLLNSDVTRAGAVESYFLGETYDSHLDGIVGKLDASSGMAMMCKLSDGHTALDKGDQQQEAQAPKSSWVLSQHIGEHDEHIVNQSTGEYQSGVTKLFRLEGLDDGAWASGNIKVEISDITAASGEFDPYGSFTVSLRTASDSDMAPQYLERYSGCNLNPASKDYVARRVGDMATIWSYVENRYKTVGQYPPLSKFVRVVMNEDVDAGVTDPGLIPFGFQGPPTPRGLKVTITAGEAADAAIAGHNLADGGDTDTLSSGKRAIAAGAMSGLPGGEDSVVNLMFPSQACRQDSEEGRLSAGDLAAFGASSNEAGTTRRDASYSEALSPWSANVDNHDIVRESDEAITRNSLRSDGSYDPADAAETALVGSAVAAGDIRAAAGDVEAEGVVPNFTLDDLCMSNIESGAGAYKKSEQHCVWKPGARRAGASISVLGNAAWASTDSTPDAGTGDFKSVLEHGFDSFCLPMVGGSDGVDITHKEPFANAVLKDGTPQGNYAYNSVKRAIDSIADPEVVECNLAAIPGLTNEGLTNHLLTTCESRADALAIIDVEGDYTPSTENKDAEADRLPNPKTAASTMKDRRLNTSYGCAYFPWVQIRDTINDAVLWAPPSVVALGTMASSQRKTEVWFAPAGFKRGGLTEGSAGLPVSQVRYRLTSKERDALYEANINPIATFPSEGIVVFGQKTLQVTPSALDRINVRRLMIFLKKEISRIAATILFDQNTSVTWQRFRAQVEPFLASVKSRFGLSDFKVILDETTTTPDLVDRNILYAKIMLKPARAIEFIALDFVITRSGASFED